MTKRKTLSAPWEKAVNLGPSVNTPVSEYNPGISPDGRMLYFVRDHDIWQAPIIINERNSDSEKLTRSVEQTEQHNLGEEVMPE